MDYILHKLRKWYEYWDSKLEVNECRMYFLKEKKNEIKEIR